MSWTDERVELLKKMWAEGQSASQIAKELGGVTRNAVIGKVHRLGLSNRTGAAGGAAAAAPTKEVKAPKEAKAKPAPKPAEPEVAAKPREPAAPVAETRPELRHLAGEALPLREQLFAADIDDDVHQVLPAGAERTDEKWVPSAAAEQNGHALGADHPEHRPDEGQTYYVEKTHSRSTACNAAMSSGGA